MNIMTDGIKKGRKYAQVLDGARQVFMADGFEGASVDKIARTAGVSKATLYSYFTDKKSLFSEVVHTECARQADAAISEMDMTAPARQVLSTAASHIFRICVAESDRFPEIGFAFYDSGPRVVRETLMLYFDKAIEAGQLRIDDKALAACQFPELCKAELFHKIIFKIQDDFSRAEIDRIINGAVDTFLARYGTDS